MKTDAIEYKLKKLGFGELCNLIDYCLQNERKISQKNLCFVTNEITILSKYIDVLEEIISEKPIYNPPQQISITKSISESEKIKNEIQLEKSKYKKGIKKSRIELSIKDNQLNNLKDKLKKLEGETNISAYNTLLLWAIKLDKVDKNSNKPEIEKSHLLEMAEIKGEIFSLEKEVNKLKDFLSNEKESFDKILEIKNLQLKKAEQNDRKLGFKFTKDNNQNLVEYNKLFNQKMQEYERSAIIRKRIVTRLRSELNNLGQSKLQIEKLNWKLLPDSEISIGKIKEYIFSCSKLNKDDFDFSRIEKILELRADKIYCGVNDFDGYLVFYFNNIQIAVLDCPVKGNAIYILEENWRQLSRLSKFDLLNYHFDKTRRIIHRGDWFEKLKLQLINSVIR